MDLVSLLNPLPQVSFQQSLGVSCNFFKNW
uniref:Uncharacterized protein n=1 Tax=Arundo donax TaxID=35708 RepID=A0A0A9B9B3_ARUDO